MTQNGVTQESVFILRRLGEAFPFASPEYATASGKAYWLVTVVLLTLIGLALAARTLLSGREGGISFFKWFLAGTQAALFLIPAICVGVAREVDGEVLWWVLSASTLICGCLMTILMYIKDARTIGLWALLLAPLRMCVYVALLACFLLPAIQTWEETEKRSRVLIVIDVSPSITAISDELSRVPGVKPKTRLAKVLDFLTDEDVKFVSRLTEKNPVFVYRFGTRLDEAGDELGQGSANWSREEWNAWTSYDFKPYALKGISEAGQTELKTMPAWKAGEPGNADWATQFAKAAETEAIPPTLGEEDKKALLNNREKLEKRVDVARSLILGTNVPDSLLTAVNRESANMVQGIIVFSDGRSNLGSDSAIGDLRDRATKEKIPIFTIAVGEKRENVEIVITDLASPDSTQPDEPQKILVEVDGKGLQNQTATVLLGIYLPGKDPKKESPTHTMTKEVTFAPGDPPHGLVEFTIDSDELAKDESGKELVEASKKIGRAHQLKTGAFQLVAKVARDKREIFADEFHVSPIRTMQVVDKPVRILMLASGPNREYQTLRTLLVREMGEKRAEVCIYLQTEGGITGEIVQDVPPERLLTRFPDRLDTTKKVVADTPEGKLEKYYNLDEYDLIIAFDFDWNEKDKSNQLRITDQSIKNVETWVNNLGGGFLLVAAPLHTFQFARTEEEDGRLKPLLNVLPVVPDDVVNITKKGVPRTPRRLNLKPTTEADLLKLEDDGRQDKPTAGWEKFFIASDKPGEELSLKRGIFSYYPVKAVKPGATVLAEFVAAGDQNTASMQPWFVVSQAGGGRTGWLGSGETYRLRAADPNYFDRFWLKLTRYLSAKREAKAARGRILLNKEFTAGGPIRMQVRVLQPSGDAYAENAINPKFKVTQYNANGDQLKILGPFELKPRKGGEKFEGYYTGQVTADAKQFPHGDSRYKVTVEVPDSPGDTLDAEFIVRKSDPELDETRPDFAAMDRMAGTVDEVKGKLNDAVKLQKLMGANIDAAKARLTMKLSETDRIAVIPDCMDKKFNKQRNLGGIDDLWDDEYEPNGLLHEVAHVQLVPSASIGLIANVTRLGTLMSLPFFLVMTVLIIFGQWSGLLAQLLRIASLSLGMLASLAFVAYAVAGFFSSAVSEQGPAGKIVELVIAGLIFVPLLVSFVGLFVFWGSDMFRAQASRMGALFVGLQGAFLVYAGYSFPVAIALLVIVSFLCIEWLSRKLLRLA